MLAVNAGTGLVAAAASRAGADLLVVYNTGHFRAHGQPSLAGLLPYGDANAIVTDLGSRILPMAGDVPVLAGVCATDPFRSVPELLGRLKRMGFAGVQNFPTVGVYDGAFRADLDATGITLEREIEMVAHAHEHDLFFGAFACDTETAVAMTQAGADAIVAHVGVTREDSDPSETVDRIQEMRDAAVAVRPDVVVLFHGGPSGSPRQVEGVLSATRGVAGYIAASSVERAPVEQAVEAATRSFAGLRTNPDHFADAPLEPPLPLDPASLPDYLRGKQLVSDTAPVKVTELGGGISNALLLYQSDAERGVVKQARPRIRVQEEWLCDVRRNLVEQDAMQLLAGILPPGTVPALKLTDEGNFTVVMEAADPNARLWKSDLLGGVIDVDVAHRAGKLLGTIHGRTAGDVGLRRRFTTELLSQLRVDPYYITTAKRHPGQAPHFERAVRQLLSSRRALVHGDYVPKNILVTPQGSLTLVDYEIVHYGEPAYDVATLINHLLLKAHAASEHALTLGEAVKAFLQAYEGEAGTVAPPDGDVLLQLGCLMLARVDGKSPVEYLSREETKQQVRATARGILDGHHATVSELIDQLTADLAEQAPPV